ncbi:MAG: hypothetical protein H6765_10795 [Candidatus Peribacteria bacterium]|nr:MAG: hypothetical protein H6765_10795 [Candidatus Peribacteria bacterium]
MSLKLDDEQILEQSTALQAKSSDLLLQTQKLATDIEEALLAIPSKYKESKN